MKNQEIAKIFYEIADVLEIQKVEWKPRAYRYAARQINYLTIDLAEIYNKKGLSGLEEIPGIGTQLAEKIKEYLKTGKIKEYEKLRGKIPHGLEEIIHIPGVGVKKAWRLYKELNINNLKKLKLAIKNKKIQKLPRFGEKSEKEILSGIEMYKKNKGRIKINIAQELAKEIKEKLERQKFIKKIKIAGSIRRRKETSKDVDILVVSKDAKKVMDYFLSIPNIKQIISKGLTKTSVFLHEGISCDLRVVSEKSYGSAIQYFTGSKEHNVKLRQIAISKGYKLNEYGLFSSKNGKYICGKNEKEIYSKLGFCEIPPELREAKGELDLKIKIPKLIKYDSVQGSLHNHSTWSDGDNSPEDMIKQAIKLGHKYYAQTDHSPYSRLAHGMGQTKLKKYLEEIKKLKKKYLGKIKILCGSEVDILKNGKLDYDKKTLEQLDLVIAAVHFRFKQNKKDMTNRIIDALHNNQVSIFAHPTGRLINERLAYEFDLEKVFQTAKEQKVILEINAQPKRLDLKDSHIKLAKEIGCKFVINCDAHATNQLEFLNYGIAQARRGWLSAKNVINTKNWKDLTKYIK